MRFPFSVRRPGAAGTCPSVGSHAAIHFCLSDSARQGHRACKPKRSRSTAGQFRAPSFPLTYAANSSELARGCTQHRAGPHGALPRRHRCAPLHCGSSQQPCAHQHRNDERNTRKNQQQIRPEQALLDVAERIRRRVADLRRSRRHEGLHAHRYGHERILRLASREGRAPLQRVLHPVADLQPRQGDVLAEELLTEHPHRVLVLEKSARRILNIAESLAADDIERNQV